MKYFSYIVLFTYSLIPLFSFSENRQTKVDSLQLVLQHAHLDTNNVLTKIELSSQLYEMDEYEKALQYAQQAKSLAERLNFKSGLAESQRYIGAIFIEQGRSSEAIEWLLKSLHIYESIKNDYGAFRVNNNLGTAYYYQKDNQKALEYYFKSYAYENNDGRTCSNIGMVYIDQENYLLSLTFFKRALNYFQSVSDKNNVATMLNNIGSVHEGQNQNDSALAYYFKALKIKEEIQDYKGQADILGGIGDILMMQKKYSKAISYQNKSLSISKKIGYSNGIKLTEQTLSELYTRLREYDKALAHYKQFTIAKEYMFNEENTRRTVNAEKDFEFQKRIELAKAEQDAKDAITIQEKQGQRIIIYSVSIVLFLVMLLAIFIFRGYKQKQETNISLQEKNKIILEKNKEITDNINYAKRIQDAVMTPISQIEESLPNSFSLNKPRDIVSGDFLFMETYKDDIIIAVADCTNHGVSGSMMTILCNNLLSEAITLGIYSPADILNYVNTTISKKFHQTDGNTKKESDIVKDGMDIVLIKINLESMRYEFAGAYNPLLVVRENQLIEVKADKLQIGQTKEQYKNHEGQFQKGDMLYLSSDGYADQFSSEGKKFMKKRFKELLISISEKSVKEQSSILEETISMWKNGYEQTDDILVMGIKI